MLPFYVIPWPSWKTFHKWWAAVPGFLQQLPPRVPISQNAWKGIWQPKKQLSEKYSNYVIAVRGQSGTPLEPRTDKTVHDVEASTYYFFVWRRKKTIRAFVLGYMHAHLAPIGALHPSTRPQRPKDGFLFPAGICASQQGLQGASLVTTK